MPRTGCSREWRAREEAGDDGGPGGSFHVATTISEADLFFLGWIHCGAAGSEPAAIEMTYVMLNPGGRQLGTHDYPLWIAYLILLALWSVLASLSFFNWFRHRDVYRQIPLQRFLLVPPCFATAHIVLSFIYWYDCTSTGKCETGMADSFLHAFFTTGYRVGVFCSLLLFSKGWCTMRAKLQPNEYRTVAFIVAGLGTSKLCFHVFDSFIALMAQLTFHITGICIILVSARQTIGEARQELASHDLDDIGDVLTMEENERVARQSEPKAGQMAYVPQRVSAHKLQMLLTFRRIMVLYFIAETVFFLIVLPTNPRTWLATTFSETMDVSLFIALNLTFRLKDVRIEARDFSAADRQMDEAEAEWLVF